MNFYKLAEGNRDKIIVSKQGQEDLKLTFRLNLNLSYLR